MSDTGVQDMDDATLAALIRQARNAPRAADGRDDTIAQRIADALGITQNVPESVRQEALAQYRSQRGENGLMYRTLYDAGSKTAHQIAHELTDHTDNYGWNYGGGRAYGTGLYFAAQGARSTPGESAQHSAGYGYGRRNPYTIEARLKPSARIATDADLTSAAGRAWAKSHSRALKSIGLNVNARGDIARSSSWNGSRADMTTTVALLMGYDGYKESSSTSVYHTIFNLGALQVARGNKYARAVNGSLTQ